MQMPIACVLAIILNNKGEVLFVKQKTLPYKGWWLLPGGHVKFGETSRDAVVREVEEETGLVVKVSKLLGVFDVIDTKQNFHFIHAVFLCESIGGRLKAGSDASDIKWFNPNMLNKAQIDLKRILRETGFIKN